MSILKLELKEEHLKLLKYLRWSNNDDNVIVGISEEEYSAPFGEDSIYEAIDIILNGMPEDFDPLNTEELITYSDEQKAEWDKLYSQLPMALDIILFNGNFELGNYRTKFNDRKWVKK